MENLFDFAVTNARLQAAPHSHRNDPLTSFEAGDRAVKSGRRNRETQWVMEQIEKIGRDNFTALELAGGVRDQNYYIIQKRLSVLAHKHKITQTKEVRKRHQVWKLT